MNKNNLTGLLSRRSRAGVLASGLLGAHLVIIALSACTGVGLAGPDSERRISARESEDHRLSRGHRSEDKIISGETTEIAGGMASTWARVNGAGKVIWVGLTIPLSMVEQMPPPGSGPTGAVAVLNFPQVVQETTYFNHAEIHSNPLGHPNGLGADPHRYETPHFDFHFYSISVEDVFAIPGGLFFEDAPPERLPEGYGQPEPFSVPQMGRHDSSFAERAATGPLDFTMLVGFLPDASFMHFLEPMMSQEFLLRRESFDLPVPIPSVLGRSTRYPTECVVRYDEDADAYHIVFKGFPPIE